MSWGDTAGATPAPASDSFAVFSPSDDYSSTESFDSPTRSPEPESSIPSFRVYPSSGNLEGNNNCSFKNNRNSEIACRHLAWSFLLKDDKKERGDDKTLIYDYRDAFASESSMRDKIDLADNHVDHYQIEHRADAYYALPIADNGLGIVLQHVCKAMPLNSKKSFLLYTENHTMAIVVRYKGAESSSAYYSVKLYDPNITLAHQRAVAKDFSDLSALCCEHFLFGDGFRASYAPTCNVAVLLYYENPNQLNTLINEHHALPPPKANKIEILPEFIWRITPQELYSFYMALNALTPEIMARYSGSLGTQNFYFSRGIVHGSTQAVIHYLNAVFSNPDLTSEQLMALLNITEDGSSGLAIAMLYGYTETVSIFVNQVLNCERLSVEQKMALVIAQLESGSRGLTIALHNHHIETARAYIREILSSSLPILQQVQLLCAHPSVNNAYAKLLLTWSWPVRFIESTVEARFIQTLGNHVPAIALYFAYFLGWNDSIRSAPIIGDTITLLTELHLQCIERNEAEISWETVAWIGMSYRHKTLYRSAGKLDKIRIALDMLRDAKHHLCLTEESGMLARGYLQGLRYNSLKNSIGMLARYISRSLKVPMPSLLHRWGFKN